MAQVIINKNNQVFSTFDSVNNISIKNSKILIDGKDVTSDLNTKNDYIKIEVIGNIEELNVDNCKTISVKGNVGNIKTTSGDVCVSETSYNIVTTSGDVNVTNDIKGFVNTISGDVLAKNIHGNVATVSGDISVK